NYIHPPVGNPYAKANFGRVVKPHDDKRSRWNGALQRPDSSIINDSIPLFAIGRNAAGLWVARDLDGSASGTFLFKRSAIRFARRIRGYDGCALMFVQRLELGRDASQAADAVVKTKLARAIASIKMRIEIFLHPG